MDLIELKSLMDDYPESIKSPVQTSEPNEEIPIHDGTFVLKIDGVQQEINGKIYLRWLPTPKIIFEGVLSAPDTFPTSFDTYHPVTVESLPFGVAAITSRQIGSNSIWKGTILHQAVGGDKSVPAELVYFVIPNIRDISGDRVRTKVDETTKVYTGRRIFKFGDFTLTIDKAGQYTKILEKVKSSGGYVMLYSGNITSDKGSISYSDLSKQLDKIHHFFYFLDGRRSVPLFFSGMSDERLIWQDYTPYHCDPYQYVPSWSEIDGLNGLQDICDSFDKYWKNESDRYFLKNAIHWYIEANANAALVEGSIILVQTALELIFNWLLIDKNKVIVGKDAESLSAANKIRLVLSQLNISSDIPASLSELTALHNILDGPDVFVQIRNALVHGQEKKRLVLNNITLGGKNQALQLGLWYIELSLLKILGYRGNYKNRVSIDRWRGAGEKTPWAQ